MKDNNEKKMRRILKKASIILIGMFLCSCSAAGNIMGRKDEELQPVSVFLTAKGLKDVLKEEGLYADVTYFDGSTRKIYAKGGALVDATYDDQGRIKKAVSERDEVFDIYDTGKFSKIIDYSLTERAGKLIDPQILETVETSQSDEFRTAVYNVKANSRSDHLLEYGISSEDVEDIVVTVVCSADPYLPVSINEKVVYSGEREDLEVMNCEIGKAEPDEDVAALFEEHFQHSGEIVDLMVISGLATADERSITYRIAGSDPVEVLPPVGMSAAKGNEGIYYLLEEGKSITEVRKEEVPAEQDASDFVSLIQIIPDIIVETRYYTSFNFVGERIDGYEEPVALLTKEAAAALKKAADKLRSQGYILKIYDAYRPARAVDHFVRWGGDLSDTRMMEYFYPDVDKSELFERGYIAYNSSHSRGSTVDLSLVDMKTGKDVDMGTGFDLFSEKSHPDYKGITDEQYENRMLLRKVMTESGFEPYEEEWWHFTLKDEPYPDTYFDFPNSRSSLMQ